jgi:hypothetical protein
MYFKERGTTVTLIRNGYDSKTKKATRETLGRFVRTSKTLPADIEKKLSVSERAELKAYLGKTRELDRLRLKVSAFSIAQTAEDAAKYVTLVEDQNELAVLKQYFGDAAAFLKRANFEAMNRQATTTRKRASSSPEESDDN